MLNKHVSLYLSPFRDGSGLVIMLLHTLPSEVFIVLTKRLPIDSFKQLLTQREINYIDLKNNFSVTKRVEH